MHFIHHEIWTWSAFMWVNLWSLRSISFQKLNIIENLRSIGKSFFFKTTIYHRWSNETTNFFHLPLIFVTQYLKKKAVDQQFPKKGKSELPKSLSFQTKPRMTFTFTVKMKSHLTCSVPRWSILMRITVHTPASNKRPLVPLWWSAFASQHHVL